MSKLIQNFRVRIDRAEKLKELSMDMTVEQRERVTEADLVNHLIDNYLHSIENHTKIKKQGR